MPEARGNCNCPFDINASGCPKTQVGQLAPKLAPTVERLGDKPRAPKATVHGNGFMAALTREDVTRLALDSVRVVTSTRAFAGTKRRGLAMPGFRHREDQLLMKTLAPPFAGRDSHPLDDMPNFMNSSHDSLPSDQPFLVALFVLCTMQMRGWLRVGEPSTYWHR